MSMSYGQRHPTPVRGVDHVAGATGEREQQDGEAEPPFERIDQRAEKKETE
jgi:hypothetical protein